MPKLRDLTGRIVGRWTVLRLHSTGASTYWWCRCACGTEKPVLAYMLAHNKSQSCGCRGPQWQSRQRVGEKYKGQRYGRLVVLGTGESFGVQCLCDCGTKLDVQHFNLKSGRISSCGCWRIESHRPLAFNEGLWNRIRRSYKIAARNRGYKWELPDEVFDKLIKSPCHYCGLSPSNTCVATPGSYGDKVLYSGVDRVDNTQGYTAENCVPCCAICNTAKSDLSTSEWKIYLDRLVAFRSEKSVLGAYGR